jgi:hypothetical protein
MIQERKLHFWREGEEEDKVLKTLALWKLQKVVDSKYNVTDLHDSKLTVKLRCISRDRTCGLKSAVVPSLWSPTFLH